MARPHKQTVDYFPHDTDASEGKTLTILQAKYGNDGYAFWFKLLQTLGKSPGHYYNFNNPADWEFLLAKTHCNDTDTVKGILDTLSLLGAIDPELYACGYIWSDNFVEGIADAYNRSIEGPPERPSFLVNVAIPVVNVPSNGECVDSNPGIITEIPQTKRRLKETKGKETILPDWIDKELWGAFLEIRKHKKAAATEFALKLLIDKLAELKEAGDDPSKVLKESIMRNWTGVFPLKGGGNGQTGRPTRQEPADDDGIAASLARLPKTHD